MRYGCLFLSCLGRCFFWNLFDDFTPEKGSFFKNEDGSWIVFNCVGLSIMALIPIFSIALSFVKSPIKTADGHGVQKTLEYKGSNEGLVISVVAFVMSIVSAAVLIILIAGQGIRNIPEMSMTLIYYALVVGVLAVGLANYQLVKLDRSSITPSVFSRWGGVIATLDISTSIALILIGLSAAATGVEKVAEQTSQTVTAEKLTSTSYIILAVVSLLIAGGLSWCFWRAMTASSDDIDVQYPSD